MGHLDSTYLASIALASMIFIFLYGNFNFLRMGSTGIVAQYFGQKNTYEISYTLYRAMILSFFLALVIFLFREPIVQISSYLLNSNYMYESHIREYFDIRIYSVFGVFFSFALIGWYFGVSNSLVPLYMTLVANGSNIVISYLLVNKFDMGIGGAAYGTMISQYLGVFVGLYFLKKYELVKFDFKTVVLKEKLLRLFHINRDIFIRTTILTLSLATLYSFASSNSKESLILVTIVLQFITWSSYAIDGFANAAESLVGRYYGARDRINFYKSIRYSFYYGGGFAVVISFLYLFFLEEFIQIFTSDMIAVQKVQEYKMFVVFTPLISFATFIWDGVLVGMTKTKVLRNSVILATATFLGVFYITKDFNYEFWLLFSFMLFFVVRWLYQSIWFLFFFDKMFLCKK